MCSRYPKSCFLFLVSLYIVFFLTWPILTGAEERKVHKYEQELHDNVFVPCSFAIMDKHGIDEDIELRSYYLKVLQLNERESYEGMIAAGINHINTTNLMGLGSGPKKFMTLEERKDYYKVATEICINGEEL